MVKIYPNSRFRVDVRGSDQFTVGDPQFRAKLEAEIVGEDAVALLGDEVAWGHVKRNGEAPFGRTSSPHQLSLREIPDTGKKSAGLTLNGEGHLEAKEDGIAVFSFLRR